MITLYGLKNCDTCRKASKALAGAGQEVTLVDIRAEADIAALAPIWLEAVGGEVLINKKSTSWRGLGEGDRAKANGNADEITGLLAENPTLIKRPVMVTQTGDIHVGWTSSVQTSLGL